MIPLMSSSSGVPQLAPRDTEAVFDKVGMSAFEGTPLDTALRDCGIRAFVIVGVALEIGIEPTVRQISVTSRSWSRMRAGPAMTTPANARSRAFDT
jgi:nicotinamidase-related amidase